MPILLRSDEFHIGFENEEGGSGLLSIKINQKLTRESLNRIVDVVREGILENFRQTHDISNVNNVCQQLSEEFGEALSVTVDSNILRRDIQNVRELFVEWYGENVDLSFIVKDSPYFPSVLISSEGSEDLIYDLFKMYMICV